MPTPSEQKALAFVAIVIVLGGAVRVLRAGSPETATPSEQQAIARQAFAAESAAQHAARPHAGRTGRKGGRVAPQGLDGGANVVGGVAGVPFSDVRPGFPSPARPTSPLGFPPPSSRIDVDNRLASGMMVVGPPGTATNRPTLGSTAIPIDLDLATAAEIEALPRIGPALAARIVASRDSAGPFGSLQALGRVRGIGPVMRRQLEPLVTFSGRAASLGVRSHY
jgi:hypothetical protein